MDRARLTDRGSTVANIEGEGVKDSNQDQPRARAQRVPSRSRSQRSPSRLSAAMGRFTAVPQPDRTASVAPLVSSHSPPISEREPLVRPYPRQAPVRSRRQAARHSQPGTPQRTLAWESTVICSVNLILTAAAIGGAVRLLPYQLDQHRRLPELERQVDNMSERVSRLQNTLDRGMDPEQKNALIKERFNKVPPNHLQVRLVPAPIDASRIAGDSANALQQAQAYPAQAEPIPSP